MKILLTLFLAAMPPQHPRAFGPDDFARFQKMENAQRHLEQEEKFARRVYEHQHCPLTYARLTAKYAVENHISARLLASLVVVESSCQVNAVSPHHAVGLTQIVPHWHPEVQRDKLCDPEYNLAAGARILTASIRKYGLHDGVANYEAGADKETYANRVLQIAYQ